MIDVYFGTLFSQHLSNFPKSDQLKIKQFADHIRKHGFEGLQGRNKSSADVPFDNPNWLAHVNHAQDNKLWHYHIGIPCYETSPNGDLTSEYILHYIRDDEFIVLVDMSAHPPFELPSLDYLAYQK